MEFNDLVKRLLEENKVPEEGAEGTSFTLDDVLESGMEILADYGAYEANLRGPETKGAGVDSLKDLVEYYLDKLGLTDTDAMYYKKRHETYQAIWDENFRLNKELLSHADKNERKDQEILNQRYNAMILSAMNAPQEGEEEDDTPEEDAEYRGRKVKLNKPTRGDVKKFKVYVKDPKTGNVKKVNFGHGGTSAKRKGEKTMKIRKSNPKARKSFRARHNCDNPGPKTKARYWSCRKW